MKMSLFHVDKSVHKKALELFDRTEESFEQDVETVKKWLQTQAHLPEVMDDVKIRNFLLLNKCSVEKTKQKIDMYYTIRGLIPDMYEDSNPNLPQLKAYLDTCYVVPFPKLLDGLYRVTFVKLQKPGELAPMTVSKLMFDTHEVRLKEDCMVGDIYVYDVKGCTLTDLMQFTPPRFKKVFSIYENVYSMRLKAIYIINSLPYINNIVAILKILMKQKLFARVQVYEDAKVLKEHFPDDNLPRDYGGTGPSLEELNDMLKKKFSEHRERFDQLDAMKVDESLRPEKLNNDDLLGFYGNFKQLSVD